MGRGLLEYGQHTHSLLLGHNAQSFSTEYDNCYNAGRAGYNLISYERYANMSRALQSTGRDIVYAMCNWGEDGPWNWAPVSAFIEQRSERLICLQTIAHTWRISGDIIDVWVYLLFLSPGFSSFIGYSNSIDTMTAAPVHP